MAQAGPAPTGTVANTSADTAALTLTFDVGAQTGLIMVALFDSAEAYDGRGAPVGQTVVDVASGQRTAAFAGLKSGTYAAKIFHDVDGDGQMATNPFGMPTEPYAFTNNARGNMGPAGWDRANVVVTGAIAQTISLR
ncbi:MAG: hypothetical protein DCF28_07640 [Alphaproteobacteria bacterium]|nr:MAG: hypothetical protein DCF28_07640 [Alphaproteobacteria bacterium]